MGNRMRKTGDCFPPRAGISLFATTFERPVGPTQPSVWWVLLAKRQKCEAIIQLQPMHRLRISGAKPQHIHAHKRPSGVVLN